MSEVVIQTGSSYEYVKESFFNATTWLNEEMPFYSVAHKMVPEQDRWEMMTMDPEDPNFSRVEETYEDCHPWLKNFMWTQHVDEFYAETGCTMERETLFYLLQQSGEGWKRWYCIFGKEDPNVTYYLATVFEDLADAIVYRLSV